MFWCLFILLQGLQKRSCFWHRLNSVPPIYTVQLYDVHCNERSNRLDASAQKGLDDSKRTKVIIGISPTELYKKHYLNIRLTLFVLHSPIFQLSPPLLQRGAEHKRNLQQIYKLIFSHSEAKGRKHSSVQGFWGFKSKTSRQQHSQH